MALPPAALNLSPEEVGLGDAELLAPAVAVLLMLAWIGVAFAAGWALLRRRDLE